METESSTHLGCPFSDSLPHHMTTTVGLKPRQFPYGNLKSLFCGVFVTTRRPLSRKGNSIQAHLSNTRSWTYQVTMHPAASSAAKATSSARIVTNRSPSAPGSPFSTLHRRITDLPFSLLWDSLRHTDTYRTLSTHNPQPAQTTFKWSPSFLRLEC